MGFLLIAIYIVIGGFVSFALRRLYLLADYRKYGEYRSEDNEMHCVIIGVLWFIAAPFAFAIFFARYGNPLNKKDN